MARTARFFLYCLLVWAPLPLASNRPLFWALNGVVATLILLLFVLGEATADRRPQLDWQLAAWPITALLVWVGWMLFQAMPGIPADFAYRFPGALADLVAGAAATVSGSPSATWATIAETVPIVFLGVVAMRLAFNPARGVFLLNLIVVATVAVAAYGLCARYFGFDQIFVYDPGDTEGFLTGTFVGRSAAASYFVIGLAAATALLASRLRNRLARSGAGRNVSLAVAELLSSGGGYLIAGLILSAAILNTGSRGGVSAAAVALVTVALLSLRGAGAARRTVAAMFVVVLAALFIVVAISSSVLFQRLQSGVGSGDRLLVYEDTASMIAERPLLGHGAGAYADLFPLYHDAAPGYAVWNKAHNTYLQAAAELGLPIAILLGLAILFVLVVTWRETRGNASTPVATAALAASAALGYHALIDFTVQIQAITLTLVVLVGAGFGEALRCRSERRHEVPVRPTGEMAVSYAVVPATR